MNVIKVLFLSPLLVFFTGSILTLRGLPAGWALGVGVLAVVALWGLGIYQAMSPDTVVMTADEFPLRSLNRRPQQFMPSRE